MTDSLAVPTVADTTGHRNDADDSDECCPLFDPAPWDRTTHVWDGRLFLTDEVAQIFHVPVRMSEHVQRMFAAAAEANALPDRTQSHVLMHEKSTWKSELLLAVTKDIPGANVTTISGTFFSMVFDGPYKETGHWITAVNEELAMRHAKAETIYLQYAYCPKCMKKYGHNYCVVFAKLAE